MEFFIKKNSTLPKLQIEVLNESRFGYSQLDEMISASTITLSLFDPEKEVYKLVNRPSIALPNEDGSGFYISYQFTQKETSKLGRYLATFKIVNSRGEYEVPVNDDLWVTIGESFADSEMCCKRRKPINLLTLDIDVVCNDIVEAEYTLSSTYPVDGDVDILFDNYIYVNDGDDIVDQLIMTLEKGQNTTTYVKRHNVSCFKLDRSSVLRNISIDVKCNSRYSYRYNDNIDFLITPTPTPTMTPTNTPTPSITPSVTPSVSITQTLTPTPTNTPEVSNTVTPTNTPQVTNTVTPTTSVTPTSTPISTSTPTTSVPPTSTPTPTPSSSEVVDTVWQLRRINNFSECSIDLTVYRSVNTLGAVSSNYILGTDGFCYLVVNESPGTVNVTMGSGPYIECSSCLGPSVSQTPTTTPTQTPTPTQSIPLVTPTVTITSSPTTTTTPTLTQSQTPNPTQTITSTVTPSVTSTPTVTPSITSSVTPTPTQSAPFVTPTVTIVQPNSISTSFLYSEDNGIMYVNEQDQSTAVHSIIGYSGTSNTEFSVPNFYSGLTSYREDNMVNGPSNIIYVTGELKVSPGDVRVRRVNTITNQVTHEYVGGSSDSSVKTLYYGHGGSDYIAIAQRISGNSYITILNASDLTLVGNYQYTPYLNNGNNVINSLLYSNGKLLWSMPVAFIPLGSSTAYGTFDLSTNTFTTGSTQSHNAYSERELLVGTDKVYGSTYVFNSNGDTTSIGYGYYDYSNDTYTQLGVKTNPSGFNSFDVGTNNHSTTDDNNGDIYLVWLYDLVHIDGSTGNVVEVIDLVLNDIYTGRAIIFEMEFNEGQDNIWFEYLTPSSQGVIVIFE